LRRSLRFFFFDPKPFPFPLIRFLAKEGLASRVISSFGGLSTLALSVAFPVSHFGTSLQQSTRRHSGFITFFYQYALFLPSLAPTRPPAPPVQPLTWSSPPHNIDSRGSEFLHVRRARGLAHAKAGRKDTHGGAAPPAAPRPAFISRTMMLMRQHQTYLPLHLESPRFHRVNRPFSGVVYA